MKGFRKKLLIPAAVVCVVIAVGAVTIQMMLGRSLNNERLPQLVINFCRQNLDRSVTFDSVERTFAGNIRISNLNLSHSKDFNDSKSLIHAEEVLCSLDFFKLIGGTAQINNITFDNTKIFLVKNYGKSYGENFKELISLPSAVKNMKNVNPDALKIKFKNTTASYLEFFEKEQFEITCNNISASFIKRGNVMSYSLNGEIPAAASGDKNCEFNATGKVVHEDKPKWRHKFKVNELNTAYVNRFIKEYVNSEGNISGLISVTSDITLDDDVTAYELSARTKNLTIAHDKHTILKGGNLTSTLAFSMDETNQSMEIQRFKLSDENIDISLAAKKSDAKNAKILSADFKVGKMNLAKISQYFTPIEGTTFAGSIYANAKVFMDYADDTKWSVAATADVKDFEAVAGKQQIVSDGDCKLSLENRQLALNLSFVTDGSDIGVKINSDIKKFSPLTSDSNLLISSKRLSASIVARLAASAIDAVYNAAYEDSKTGYYEIFFLAKPISEYVNKNNINAVITADEIFFGKKPALSGLKIDCSLDSGVLRTDDFALAGCGGDYRFEFIGYFDRDYPSMRFAAEARNVNLGELSESMAAPYRFTGILDANASFELSAYRMMQLLQNGIGNFSANLRSGSIVNVPALKRLETWFADNNCGTADLSSVEVNSAALMITQNADNIAVRGFNIASGVGDVVGGYGRYSWRSGVALPITLNIRDAEGKIKTSRLELTGPLFSPALSIAQYGNAKKGGKPFAFTSKKDSNLQ